MGIAAGPPSLPEARGPLSEELLGRLAAPFDDHTNTRSPWPTGGGAFADAWSEDLQLALYTCYELHYRSFAGVCDAWEWDPGVLGFRREMERSFLGMVRDTLGDVPRLDDQLEALVVEPVGGGTGVSRHLLEDGHRWQASEYLVHRSMYHLKEADPQAWAIPRIHGSAQAAFVEIEYDEYGSGRPERVHSALFAAMMEDFGLRSEYGAYTDAVPAAGLAPVNLMSMFGLHRGLRGALVGQFARTEITSSPSARRLAGAFERLGAGEAGTLFYREHIEADAVHEQLIRHDVIGALIQEEPALAADIAFGLAASGMVEDRFAQYVLGCWKHGATRCWQPSRRPPPPSPPPPSPPPPPRPWPRLAPDRVRASPPAATTLGCLPRFRYGSSRSRSRVLLYGP